MSVLRTQLQEQKAMKYLRYQSLQKLVENYLILSMLS